MKKICRYCGYENPEDSHKVCPICGHPYDEDNESKKIEDSFQVLYGPGPFKDNRL